MNKTLGGNGTFSGQCSICKAMIGPEGIQEEEEEDELLINNISCCEDLLDKSMNTTLPNGTA